MRDESARHPVSITNLRPYVMYYFISAPLVFLTLPFAPVLEWRKRGLSPMLLLWLAGFCRQSASVFQLQHNRQLALFPDWTCRRLCRLVLTGCCALLKGDWEMSDARLWRARL